MGLAFFVNLFAKQMNAEVITLLALLLVRIGIATIGALRVKPYLC